MEDDDKVAKVEVSGSGSSATSGGVSSGEEGISVRGSVGGDINKANSIIQATNFIAIIGGIQSRGQDVLQDLGEEINKSLGAGPNEPDDLIQAIRAPLERYLNEQAVSNLVDYLQITGETFGPLADSYDREGGKITSFPMGDFLRDMLSLLTANELVAKVCLDAFSEEKRAMQCQDLGVVFAEPMRYRVLDLPEVEKTRQKSLAHYFPHEGPLFIYCRADALTERELFLGQFYQRENAEVICPIQFRGRSLLAFNWQQRIDNVFFELFALALLADFILYLHRLSTENRVARRLIAAIRRTKSQNPQ